MASALDWLCTSIDNMRAELTALAVVIWNFYSGQYFPNKKTLLALTYWMFNTMCSLYFCRITLLFLPKKQNKYFENLGLFLENPLTLGLLFVCLFSVTI